MPNEVRELRSPVYKINAIIPNRWHARSILQVGIALSLIALATIFINSITHVAYGLATQFTLGTFNHTALEKHTKAFLDDPIFTLSPEKARAVLSELQASVPVKMLPAEIENRTIPGGPGGKDTSITIV